MTDLLVAYRLNKAERRLVRRASGIQHSSSRTRD
jgi:hypothetical protein